MSTFVLTDVTTWVAGYDFTTDLNEMSLSVEVDEQENTTFGGGGYRSRLGGLRSVEAELGGYWQSAMTNAVDPQAFNNLGTIDRVVTVSPTGAVGSAAYMAQMGKFSYELGGGVGEVMPFSLNMVGTNGVGLVRGQIAAAKQSVNATGALGSAVNLGAGSAGKYLYAVLHVFSAGTTISVKVESDTASNFLGAADVTDATISSVTTAGGTWMARVDASSITDTWFRLNVSAVTGTFSVAGAIAVQ